MSDLARIFGVKLAFTPLPTALFGAGLGAGIGYVYGEHSDDPANSPEQHIGRGLRYGLGGAALGGLGGLGVSKAVEHLAPALFASAKAGPFPNVDMTRESKFLNKEEVLHTNADPEFERWFKDPWAPAKALGQKLYQGVYMNPAVRFGSGLAVGSGAARTFADYFDDMRFKQYAAQKAQAMNPDIPNAGRLEAHLVDRHMGPYRSSLDGAQGAE